MMMCFSVDPCFLMTSCHSRTRSISSHPGTLPSVRPTAEPHHWAMASATSPATPKHAVSILEIVFRRLPRGNRLPTRQVFRSPFRVSLAVKRPKKCRFVVSHVICTGWATELRLERIITCSIAMRDATFPRADSTATTVGWRNARWSRHLPAMRSSRHGDGCHRNGTVPLLSRGNGVSVAWRVWRTPRRRLWTFRCHRCMSDWTTRLRQRRCWKTVGQPRGCE